MADISSIKTPDNAVYDLKAKKIFYAECATARNVVNKVVDCDGFVLERGAVIAIRFTDTGTTNATSNITLNINGTGAKNIVPKNNNTVINSNWSNSFCNNVTWLFVYNGTYFVMLNQDNNATYTPMTLGFGYGTCTTAEATAAKVASLASYNLVKNGIVSVKFTYAVPANATLNINNRGAKNIFYRGAKITAGIIAAGDIATFVYDGTQYQLIAVDSRNALTVGGHTVLSNVPANAKFTDTVYTLPTAGSTLGGVKTTSTVSSASGLTACPIIGGVPYYKDTNTTPVKSITITNKILTNGATYLFSSNQIESQKFDSRKILGIKCESTNLRLYVPQVFRFTEWQVRFYYYNDVSKTLATDTDVSYTVYYVD